MPGSHRVTQTLWNACTLILLGRLAVTCLVHCLVGVPKVVTLWWQPWGICLRKRIIMFYMTFIWLTEVCSHQHNCTKVYCGIYVLLVIEKRNDLYVYIMCLYSILFQISQYTYWYTLNSLQDFCLLSHQTLLNYLSIDFFVRIVPDHVSFLLKWETSVATILILSSRVPVVTDRS